MTNLCYVNKGQQTVAVIGRMQTQQPVLKPTQKYHDCSILEGLQINNIHITDSHKKSKLVYL